MKFLNDNGPSLPFILFIYVSILLFLNLLGKGVYFAAFLLGFTLIIAVLVYFYIGRKKGREHEEKWHSIREIPTKLDRLDVFEESVFFWDSEESALKEFSHLIHPFFELSTYSDGSQVSDEDIDYFFLHTRIASFSLLDAIQLAYRREWATLVTNQKVANKWSVRRNWAITALERLNRVFPKSVAIEDIPFDIVHMVHERYKYHCSACGREIWGKHPVTIDHIIPVSKGGGNIPRNLHSLCGSCKQINDIGLELFLMCRFKMSGRVWYSESGSYQAH
jgi:hypothetical protein